MKVSIFGLGYVGCVTAACLAREGHEVIGVDPNELKVDLLNQGKSPIIEKDLDRILDEVVNQRQGSLTATGDGPKAVLETDVSLVCVGTPSKSNGSLSLEAVRNCAKELGSGVKLKKGRAFHHAPGHGGERDREGNRVLVREAGRAGLRRGHEP